MSQESKVSVVTGGAKALGIKSLNVYLMMDSKLPLWISTERRNSSGTIFNTR